MYLGGIGGLKNVGIGLLYSPGRLRIAQESLEHECSWVKGFQCTRVGTTLHHNCAGAVLVSTYGGPRSFFPVERGTVNLLAKACAHAKIKAIGVKTTVITSAIFAVGVFNLKKKRNIIKWRVWSFSARKSSDVL